MALEQAWWSRVKRASDTDQFAQAVQQTAASNLRHDAGVDIKNLALATLGIGAAGRGAVGLYNMIRRSTKPKKKSPQLSLPYPVAEKVAGVGLAYSLGSNGYDLARRSQGKPLSQPVQNAMLGADAGIGGVAGYYAGRKAYQNALKTGPMTTKAGAGTPMKPGGGFRGGLRGAAIGLGVGAATNLLGGQVFGKQGSVRTWSAAELTKGAGFVGGDMATTKAGIPWYGPAMMAAGIGGLGLGWKGVDHVLNKKRQRDREKELDLARQEFHDALLGQYDKPLAGAPPMPKQAADDGMAKVGAALDALYDQFEKAASASDIAGQALGGYGIYAGLTGLMTGALVYDKARKRQRRAIIEKAIQRRDRRNFNVAPPEITAVPEPFHPAKPSGDPTQSIELNV